MLQAILAYDQGRYQTRLLPWQTGENWCSCSCCSSRIFYALHADAFCRPVHVRGDLDPDPFSRLRESCCFLKFFFKAVQARSCINFAQRCFLWSFYPLMVTLTHFQGHRLSDEQGNPAESPKRWRSWDHYGFRSLQALLASGTCTL